MYIMFICSFTTVLVQQLVKWPSWTLTLSGSSCPSMSILSPAGTHWQPSSFLCYFVWYSLFVCNFSNLRCFFLLGQCSRRKHIIQNHRSHDRYVDLISKKEPGLCRKPEVLMWLMLSFLFFFGSDLCSDETDNSLPLQLHTLKQFEQVRAWLITELVVTQPCSFSMTELCRGSHLVDPRLPTGS